MKWLLWESCSDFRVSIRSLNGMVKMEFTNISDTDQVRLTISDNFTIVDEIPDLTVRTLI